MAANFETALRRVLAYEGGFSNHKNDPGGATKFGITHGVLSDWRGHKVTVQNVRDLTVAEAGEIYRARYWNAARCEDLPRGIDYAVFDCAVNQGIGRAARFLQLASGAKVDGWIGPKTLAAVNGGNPVEIITEFFARRMHAYGSLPSLFRTFGKGWSRRLMDAHMISVNMCNNQPTDVVHSITYQPDSASDPTPHTNPPQNPASGDGDMPMSMIDILLGGELLKGRKTIIGIVGYVMLFLAHANGALPDFITESYYQQLLTIFGGLAGLGLTSKFVRIMRFFGIEDKPRVETVATGTDVPKHDPFAAR